LAEFCIVMVPFTLSDETMKPSVTLIAVNMT